MYASTSKGTTLLSAGIDWVTATTEPGTRGHLVQAAAKRWVTQRIEEGHQKTSWTWNGYIGERADGISHGNRHDGTIVRLSGEPARAHGVQLITWADNVSRLDLQVTTLTENADTEWATGALCQALLHPSVKKGYIAAGIQEVHKHGATFTMGKRISDRYYRVYNKHLESRGEYPPGTWRWEIEFKRARADVIAAKLAEETNLPQAVAGLVGVCFLNYGVQIPCEWVPPGWRDQSPRHITTDERRLEWLRQAIRPLVERMYEGDKKKEVLDSLGLWERDDLKVLDIATGEVLN